MANEWLETLQPASFRGVSFLFESVESEIGRRNVVHEFPKKDTPYSEDLGRMARRFSVNIIIIGDNYHIQRDLIRNALEAPGAGKFVHPFWGEMSVVVSGGARITESSDHGGLAKISVSFSESGEKLKSDKKKDTAGALVTSADNASSALAEAFNAAYSVAKKSESVVVDAVSKINTAASKIDKARAKVAAALNIINDVKNSVDKFFGSVSAIVRLPGQIVTDVKGLINSVYGGVAEVQAAFNQTINAIFGAGNLVADSRVSTALLAHKEMMGYPSAFKTINGDSVVAVAKRENQAALVQLVCTTSVIELCRLLAELDFSTATLSQSVRDQMSSDIDSICDSADDLLYARLQDLRAALVNHLDAVALSLPSVVYYTPKKTLPALVIAHDVYGDATRDLEIVTANKIQNPNCLIGGDALRVLDE